MPLIFDATLKVILQKFTRDYEEQLGLVGPQPAVLFQGVRAMRESSTYQGILEEGAVSEAQKILQRQGQQKIGPPSDTIVALLKGISSLDRLERMSDRILNAST
jgi:hypothetical protein